MALSSAISFTLIMVPGVVLFISFLATAMLGLLAARERVPFTWHFTMAIVSLVILVIPGVLAMAYFLGI